jgi:hypothetical protein
VPLNNLQKRQKLRKLAQIEGCETVTELLELSARDSVSPAICCNPDNIACDYSTEMEPDQDQGWCDECDKGTMQSALILAGMI